MWQRFTERARRVVFFAQEEAGRLGENYVSTEHLLLGLVREDDTVAAHVLDRLGISLDHVRSEIERQVTRGDGRLGQDVQLTPRAKRVIDLAYDEARRLDNNYIGTEHLLLGLIREGEGVAGRVLSRLGMDLETTRKEVTALQDTSRQASEPVPPAANPMTHVSELVKQFVERLQAMLLMPEMEAAAKTAGQDIEGEIKRLQDEIDRIASEYTPPQPPLRPPAPGRAARPPEINNARKMICEDVFGLKGKSLLSIADLSREQIHGVLTVTAAMASAHRAQVSLIRYSYPKSLALVFEKPSLRTRVTFDLGMRQMGGLTVVLGPAEIGLGTRESVPDAARNLERWVDAVMARVFRHEVLVELRDHARVPIINGLSDREHPCQILADLYTLREKKEGLTGCKLAWVGDGNNVLHSLLFAGALTGMTIAAACPEGYGPDAEIVKQARALARRYRVRDPLDVPGSTQEDIVLTADPVEAVKDADAVYTDVWTSMGQEADAVARSAIFRPYQVNAALMAHAKPDAVFMHCLPAHRGEEVTDEVLDGPQSVVFDQAENRLHAQKAVLALVIGV